MSEIVPIAKNYATIKAALQSDRAQMAIRAAIGDELSAGRFVRMLMATIQRTPKLQECTPQSILVAGLTAAHLRLEIDGIRNLAHLVPFKQTATFILGYKGVMELATRSGKYVDFDVDVVYKGDTFDYKLGLNPVLEHIPLCPEDERIDKNITHFYAIVERKDGKKKFIVRTKKEVDAIRARSRAANEGPWVTDYVPMGMKTVLKQMKRVLELDPETDRALERDTRAETGEPVDALDIIDFDPAQVIADAEAAMTGKQEKKDSKLGKLAERVQDGDKAKAQTQAAPPTTAPAPAATITPASPAPMREPGEDREEPAQGKPLF